MGLNTTGTYGFVARWVDFFFRVRFAGVNEDQSRGFCSSDNVLSSWNSAVCKDIRRRHSLRQKRREDSSERKSGIPALLRSNDAINRTSHKKAHIGSVHKRGMRIICAAERQKGTCTASRSWRSCFLTHGDEMKAEQWATHRKNFWRKNLRQLWQREY